MVISIVLLASNGYLPLGIRFIKKFLHYYHGNSKIQFYIFGNEDPYQYLSDEESKYVIPVYHKCRYCRDGVYAKYENIMSLRNVLSNYIFYFDADTDIVSPFNEKWFIGDMCASEHFDNKIGMKDQKPYDRYPRSSCYISYDTKLDQQYYHAQFFGGKKQNILNFCTKIIGLIDRNKKMKHEPIWNDESYINFYFHKNPPTKMIEYKNFQFRVSDKGGLENLRNPKLDLTFLKKRMIKNRNNTYDLIDGRISNILKNSS